MMPRARAVFDDFSGGLDLVSDPAEIAPNMTRFALNARIKGGGSYVEGFPPTALMRSNTGTNLPPAGGHSLGFFPAPRDTPNGAFVVVAAAATWTKIDRVADTQRFGGVPTNIRTGLTTAGGNDPIAGKEVKFLYNGGFLYGLDPRNNIARINSAGTVVTAAPGVNTGPPLGRLLGIFDNKMFVAVHTGGVAGMTIVWSSVVDATNGFINTANMWPTANTVTLGGSGSTDDEYITGAAVTPDGLTVFTTKRMWLIYDSATGANTVVDENAGVLDGRSIAVSNGVIWAANQRGVFTTTGRLPAEYVTDRYLKPLFDTHPIRTDLGMPGTIHDGSYWLSFTYDSGNILSILLEIKLDTKAGMVQNVYAVSNQLDLLSVNLRPTSAQALGWEAGIGDVLISVGGSTTVLYKLLGRDSPEISGRLDLFSQYPMYYQLPYEHFGDDTRAKRLRRISIVGRSGDALGVATVMQARYSTNYLEQRQYANDLVPAAGDFILGSDRPEWRPGASTDNLTSRPFTRFNGIMQGVRGHAIGVTLVDGGGSGSYAQGMKFPLTMPIYPVFVDTPLVGAHPSAISRVELEADVLPGHWRN